MLFVIFHVMPVVRMHVESAEGLVDAYGRASDDFRDRAGVLSPLVTEAYALLGQPGQNPLYGPIPALTTLANGLADDQRDLSWRVDFLRSVDAQPFGPSGRVSAFIPADLSAAFGEVGLTPEQVEVAERLINEGVSFENAARAAQSNDPDAMVRAMRLAELNDQINNWNGTDNDPLLDALINQRDELIEGALGGGEPVAAEVLGQIIVGLSPWQVAQIEQENPGSIDIALLNAIIRDHDSTFYPGDPVDPFIENARDIRDSIVGNIAGDVAGYPDPDIAAVAQINGISYQDAKLALEVSEIDRLNDQSMSVPSPQGAAQVRDQRDAMILEFVEGNEVLAGVIGRNMSQGHDLATASQMAIAELEAIALAAYNAASQPVVEEDRGFWGDLHHNIFDGGSFVGNVVTGNHAAIAAGVVEHGPGIAQTVGNAAFEISTLSPLTPQGFHLLVTDPGQFAENYQNFGGGALDWTVDTGKLVAAVAIAGNPGLNAQVRQVTGRDIQQEVSAAVVGAAQFAAADPDAFAATVVNWEMLEEDPIRWAGEAAPEVVLEIVTGGAGAGAAGARRAARAGADAADAASDANTARRAATENPPVSPRTAATPNAAVPITPRFTDKLKRFDELGEIDTPPPPRPGTNPADIPPPPNGPLPADLAPPRAGTGPVDLINPGRTPTAARGVGDGPEVGGSSAEQFRDGSDLTDYADVDGPAAPAVSRATPELQRPTVVSERVIPDGRVLERADGTFDFVDNHGNEFNDVHLSPHDQTPFIFGKDPKQAIERTEATPTTTQANQAERYGLDPRWVDGDGNIRWVDKPGTTGTPEPRSLQPGTKIDRFGFPKSPKGSFFSPAGKPHTGRAIPPGQAERYVYEVVAPHPLPVKAGEIKPWFDDPGGQTQFELDAELIRETYGPGSGSNVSEAEFAQMLDPDGRVSFLYWFGFKG